MNITKIKGLKYPDEYFVKFFFKNKLHEKKGLKYLEFGCGNGSNLMLPYNYGNEVIGIDYDSTLIEMANYNFDNIYNGLDFNFYAEDMRSFVENAKNIKADIFILPSVIYYISRDDFTSFLLNIRKNQFIQKNIPFFIRIRTIKDFRFGYGTQIDRQRFKMPNESITGENNIEIEFYTENEIVILLKKYLDLRDYKLFSLDNQNEHDNNIVLNSDIVVWGTIN